MSDNIQPVEPGRFQVEKTVFAHAQVVAKAQKGCPDLV